MKRNKGVKKGVTGLIGKGIFRNKKGSNGSNNVRTLTKDMSINEKNVKDDITPTNNERRTP